MITKPQIIKIKTQLRQLKLESALMALDYSNGRTDHISELNNTEALQMIKYLAKVLKEPQDAQNQMARKIISMAHEIGWQLMPKAGEKPKADMQRINSWCIDYGFLHKKLNDYTKDELVRLVTQFENMYLKELKKV